MDMGYELPPLIPNIVTPPPLSRYLLRSLFKPVTPFYSKLLPLPMNEFTSAPVAVVATLSTSDIDRNNSVTVTFIADPFGPYFPETILVSGIHPPIGLDLHYDVDRHHCQLVKMDPGTPSHRLSQWKYHLRHAYILSIDNMSVHAINDVRLVIYEARSVNRKLVVVSFTKDDAPNCLSAIGLPQVHVENTLLVVVHKAIIGPKFNHRTLQNQLDWKDWLASGWMQLDNYAKQNMC
jgi:hypothetical protein